MRQTITTLLELAGMAAVTAGAALMWLPLGLVVGGVLLVGVGALVGRQ